MNQNKPRRAKRRALHPFWDLWVGAPLQANEDGQRYTVGIAQGKKEQQYQHKYYPIENAAREVIACLRLAQVRRRFIRPKS